MPPTVPTEHEEQCEVMQAHKNFLQETWRESRPCAGGSSKRTFAGTANTKIPEAIAKLEAFGICLNIAGPPRSDRNGPRFAR